MSEIKLLPCPFCGGKAEIGDCGSGTFKIQCENDCIAGNNHFLRKDINVLVRAWNTRKPMERILKRLSSKEVLENVAPSDDVLTNGYVKGIKKAIEICKEEGGIE